MLKNILGFLLIFLFSFTSQAHEYYFAFAEMEYNDITQRLEASVMVSTHDLEFALEKDEIFVGKISKLDAEQENYKNIESYLNKHFYCKQGNSIITFSIIGFEVGLNGITTFYLNSEPIDLNSKKNSVVFYFDLLTDHYPQQQNKLTYIFRNNKSTLVFNSEQPSKKLN